MTDIQRFYDVQPEKPPTMKDALKFAGLDRTYASEWRERFGRRLRGPTGAQVSNCVVPDHLVEIMYKYKYPFTWGIMLDALDHPTPVMGSNGEKASLAVRRYIIKVWLPAQ